MESLDKMDNQDMKDTVCWGTLKNYFTTQKYLEKYLKERLRVSDIGLKELNYKFVTGFEYFLKSLKPLDHHKPLGNTFIVSLVLVPFVKQFSKLYRSF